VTESGGLDGDAVMEMVRGFVGSSKNWGLSTSMLPGPPPPCDRCGAPAEEIGEQDGVPFADCLQHGDPLLG
jgi:hypothetical protein